MLMKKCARLFQFGLMSVLVIGSAGCPLGVTDTALVGTWVGEDTQGYSYTFVFRNTGTCMMTIGDGYDYERLVGFYTFDGTILMISNMFSPFYCEVDGDTLTIGVSEDDENPLVLTRQ